MKTKKFLSLVLALVMALSLAIPAFAADAVKVGDVYAFDASGVTPAGSGVTSLTVNGLAATIVDPDTSGNTTIEAQLAEWAAAASAPTGWTISIDTDGTTVLYTATADDAAVPGTAVATTTRVDSLDGLGTGASTDITTETNVPAINVIIPKSGSAILNPYKMTVSVNGADNNKQVISAMQYVKSTSNVPLKVSVKAVATPSSSDITMATKTITDKILDKQVYMYLNTCPVASTATAPTEATVTFPAYNKATAAILATGEGGTLTGVEIGAAKDNEASYLAFRLEGDMTPAPTTAWAESDTVGVTLTFTFVASALAPTTTP